MRDWLLRGDHECLDLVLEATMLSLLLLLGIDLVETFYGQHGLYVLLLWITWFASLGSAPFPTH